MPKRIAYKTAACSSKPPTADHGGGSRVAPIPARPSDMDFFFAAYQTLNASARPKGSSKPSPCAGRKGRHSVTDLGSGYKIKGDWNQIREAKSLPLRNGICSSEGLKDVEGPADQPWVTGLAQLRKLYYPRWVRSARNRFSFISAVVDIRPTTPGAEGKMRGRDCAFCLPLCGAVRHSIRSYRLFIGQNPLFTLFPAASTVVTIADI